MCISPIKIPNPNLGKDPTKFPWMLKDCTSQYIQIPCGHCAECTALDQMYYIQRVQMEALENYIFMATVTYKNETIPRITTSQGYEYRFTDYNDIYNMIRRLKKNNTFGIPFRYVYVTERGGKGGRPHAHFMFIFRRSDIGKSYEDAQNFEQQHKWDVFQEWKRVTKKGRYSESILLSDYRESYRNGIKHTTYDFHFVDPRLTESGITDVAFYVIKYMMKYEGVEELTKQGNEHERKIHSALRLNYDEEEYKETWNLIKSRKRQSLYFGLDCWDKENTPNPKVIELLKQGVERSKQTSAYPIYYCPESLLTFPLAPYYKGIGDIYNVKDALDFYYKNDKLNGSIDSWYYKDKDIIKSIQKMKDHERKLKIIERDCFSATLEELYQ